MNFREYALMEAKKEEDMTPQELKASRAAKAEYQKMLAKGRESLGLPPEDPKSPGFDAWQPRSKAGKKANAKIAKGSAAASAKMKKAIKKLENKPPRMALFRWNKPKEEKEETVDESNPVRKWQHKQARRKAEGSLGVPEGERRHKRGSRAPHPPQNLNTSGMTPEGVKRMKKDRWSAVAFKKAKRLSEMNFKEYAELGENISTTIAFTGNKSTRRLRRGNQSKQLQRRGNLGTQRDRFGNKSRVLRRVGNLSTMGREKTDLRRKSSEYDMGTRTRVGLS